jgi:hypothetical protein
MAWKYRTVEVLSAMGLVACGAGDSGHTAVVPGGGGRALRREGRPASCRRQVQRATPAASEGVG